MFDVAIRRVFSRLFMEDKWKKTAGLLLWNGSARSHIIFFGN